MNLKTKTEEFINNGGKITVIPSVKVFQKKVFNRRGEWAPVDKVRIVCENKKDIKILKKIFKNVGRTSDDLVVPSKFIDSYKAYLLSPKWRGFTNNIRKIRKHKCEKCGSNIRLQIHHKSYLNIFKETPDDVLLLCKACHELEHS